MRAASALHLCICHDVFHNSNPQGKPEFDERTVHRIGLEFVTADQFKFSIPVSTE